MRPNAIKDALLRTYDDVGSNHTLLIAAGLSYYSVLTLFPTLMLLSAIFAYLPVPDLFNQTLAVMSHLLPPDCMGLIREIAGDVITPNRGTFLSIGILGTALSCSSAFAAAIEALNVAYGVRDGRPFWKSLPLAVGLAFTIGFLLIVALAVIIVGPRFGEWLASKVHLGTLFVPIWPYFRWTIAIGFAVLAIEVLYVLAPNAKQRPLATLPGAVIAVTCWIGLSQLLGQYFRHFASLNKTYGTLGAAIALMVWLYWTGFAMLVGAELNAELAKASHGGKLLERQEPRGVSKVNNAA